jgi:hypothetical protein
MFHEWTGLNRVLGEHARTLAWYDARPATTRDRLRPLLERDVLPLLLEAERWADAGALYSDPLAELDRAAWTLRHTMTYPFPAHVIERTRKRVYRTAAHLVRALRAAGRAQEADAVAVRARELDPSAEMAEACALSPSRS